MASVDIGKFKAKFNGKMGVFKRGVLLKLFGAVIRDTPVLTGRLRGNWQFTKGEPTKAGTENTADPTGVISTQVQTEVLDKDESYYLTNSMPYAQRIEYEGWSHTKAPEGMVRRNLVRITRLLKEEAAKL